MKKTSVLVFFLTLSGLGLIFINNSTETNEESGEVQGAATEKDNSDTIQILATSPSLNRFLLLLQQRDLVTEINNLNQVTLLAPTDEAFSRVENVLSTMNDEEIEETLRCHILDYTFDEETFLNTDAFTPPSGCMIKVTHQESFSTLSTEGVNVNLTFNPINSESGSVIIIDSVLIP